MQIKLKHPKILLFPRDILTDVFEGVYTIGDLVNSTNRRCETVQSISPEDFKGFVLEFFTEYLLKNRGADNRIGINDYKTSAEASHPDNGVDGFGVGANGNPATVQVKFRQYDHILTANEDHLTNFLTQSWGVYKVPMEDTKNMLIVSTAKEMHHHTRDNMLLGKVRHLGRPELSLLVDNDAYFWDGLRKAINDAFDENVVTKPRKAIELRNHQSEALTAIRSDPNGKGKIILPTGCGKTIIEAEAVYQHLINSSTPQVVKIYGSRILLCFQLVKEVQTYLLNRGIDPDFINFNSGALDDSEYIKRYVESGFNGRAVPSTTSKARLRDAVEASKAANRHIVIFSTYHSALNSEHKDIHVDLSIYDEAHNTVNEQFKEAVDLVSDKKLFFTATEKFTDSDEGWGMNNVLRYDNTIYKRTPKEMISAGEILMPFIHVVKTQAKTQSELNDDPDNIVHSIFSAFFHHEATIKAAACNPDQIGAKVVVSAEGQKVLHAIMESPLFAAMRAKYPDIYIAALSSEYGVYKNGERFPQATNVVKQGLLDDIKALDHSARAIIFHVDMIGEGIDVPGITGVMPFRNLNVIKFVQFIGRAMRLHPIDKVRFYNGEISPDKPEGYIKPRAWVIIPDFLTNSADFGDRYKNIIRHMRYDFAFNPIEHIIYKDTNGIDEEKDIPPVNAPDDSDPFTRNGIVNFFHTLEKEEMIAAFNEEVSNVINECRKNGNDFTPFYKLWRSVEPEGTKV